MSTTPKFTGTIRERPCLQYVLRGEAVEGCEHSHPPSSFGICRNQSLKHWSRVCAKEGDSCQKCVMTKNDPAFIA